METITLEADYRSKITKGLTNKARREGYVIGSIFGHGTESIPVTIKHSDLVAKIKASESGIKSLIAMKVNGAPEKSDGTVIIKEYTTNPITRKLLDVQFQRIVATEKINVSATIILTGEAIGVKNGGNLQQTLNELQINCLPVNILSSIEVDVSGLDIGQHISVGDLKLSDDIEVLADPGTIVCTCVASHALLAAHEEEAGAAESE